MIFDLRPLFTVLIIFPVSLLTFSNRITEAFARRNVFYTGGEYTFEPSINDTILINQIYVEQLTPLGGQRHRYPIIFFHGAGVSGTVSLC